MRIYTCLAQPANALVSQHMSRAYLRRPAKKVVNDLNMHRFDSNPSSSDFSSSLDSQSRSTLSKRKGANPRQRKGENNSALRPELMIKDIYYIFIYIFTNIP